MTDEELLAYAQKSFAEVWEFRGTLSPETDRGCALMAAAYLDDQLLDLLQACLVNDAPVASGIFAHSGPLGSFSARIDFAYLMGKISKKCRRDLHLIRKIRNEFGHHSAPLGFTDEPIASRCRELHHTFLDTTKPPRDLFTNTATGLLAEIHAARYQQAHPIPRQDIDLEKAYRPSSQKEVLITQLLGEALEKESRAVEQRAPPDPSPSARGE